ncbi:MAG: methanogenesis marker 12 protein [Methanotrichaceae archaeon]|nr:methanogenesis marker 12 protein [Methanotrichaceae archaeon]
MFVGVDHGTQAIRLATSEGRCWELPRKEASRISPNGLLVLIKDELALSKVDMVALTYSMGDGLTKIVRIEDSTNRGLIQQDGAGLHIGGGTNLFEAIRISGWPCVLLPGIHRGSDIDPRLKVFSHGMSPEKVGLAYGVFRQGENSIIISDASSNTVTFAVLKGKIVGAIDAAIFAPGLMQGPLDVEAIRAVDASKMTANQAFNQGGILTKIGRSSLQDCSPHEKSLALETLALFAAMEISALQVFMRDLGEPEPAIYVGGAPSLLIRKRVAQLLCREVRSLGRYAAAMGCALIAEDIFNGADSILNIEVDERAKRNPKQDSIDI